MNNKLGLALICALIVTVLVTAVGFSYLQNEINTFKTQATNPTSTAAPTSISSINSPTPTANVPTSPYQYTVFEWTLKPENINNTNWLKAYGGYNENLTWRENYFKMISGCGAFPAGTQGSLASLHMHVNTFESVDFNEQTGYTKATYKYIGGVGGSDIYEIDLYDFLKSGSTGWTQTFV